MVRRTVRIYVQQALIFGFFAAALFAVGWWLSLAPFFDRLRVVGVAAAFIMGAAIGLIMEWQLDDDGEDE